MTLEELIREVEDETGQSVTPETCLADVVSDSLEFTDLMVRLNVPDEAVPSIETVKDLYAAIHPE